MRVLLFRPQADSERSARSLRERGHAPIIAPLFTVVPGTDAAPEGPFDALVLTSANAVASLAGAPDAWRGRIPAFCVGDRTARAAAELGYATTSAKGGRVELRKLLLETLTPRSRLLFVAGRDRHEDLPEQLRAAGHDVTVWTAYEARPIEALPEAAAEALRAGTADAALHYSPRGAKIFLDLAERAGLMAQAIALPQVALSAEVAAPLIGAGADTVFVAEHPEEAGLFAALDHLPARILLGGDVKIAPDAAEPGSETDRDEMNEPDATSDKGQSGKRRGRSGRIPPTIELKATAGESVAVETAKAGPDENVAQQAPGADAPPEAAVAEAPVTTPSEPESPSAPPAPPPVPPRAGFSLPTVTLAGLVGGVVGAGLLMLVQRQAAQEARQHIAELGNRITQLQAASASSTALAALDRKAGEASASAAKAVAEAQATTARLAELASSASSGQPADAAIADALKRADANAAAARDAATALTRRLDEAGGRLAAVENAAKSAKIPERQASAAARVVLTERIRQAIAAGRPFQAEAQALAGAGLPADQLAALNAVATKGAPTREALLALFKPHRALFARETAPAATTWESKLLGLASRVVTVRPVGDTGADDPATLPIRLENALTQDDVVKAAELWAQLPEPARRASEALGAALKQRATAQAAINRISQDAVAALGAAG